MAFRPSDGKLIMRRDLEISAYESLALREIDAFKSDTKSWFGRTLARATRPLEWATETAMETVPGQVLSKVIQGFMGIINDGASWTVRTSAIYREFRNKGHAGVMSAKEIRGLPLEDVDAVVGRLGAKYRLLAGAEGAAAGAVGLPGIAADIPGLFGLALRAANEYATYYGFDIGLESERPFVMQILFAASSPTDMSKQAALAQITKASVLIAKGKTWRQIEEILGVKLLRKLAEELGIRLTKPMLAEVLPVVGGVVAAGFNAHYLGEVTKTAFNLYRERFLIEKYGPEVLTPRVSL